MEHPYNKNIKEANSTVAFLKRNLRHCPATCRKTAYISLVRSVLEYSSIVWDPYLIKDIELLERVQRQAARFMLGDYRSREDGCVTDMLSVLDLPILQDRRRANRLTYLFKIAKGKVLALPPDLYI